MRDVASIMPVTNETTDRNPYKGTTPAGLRAYSPCMTSGRRTLYEKSPPAISRTAAAKKNRKTPLFSYLWRAGETKDQNSKAMSGRVRRKANAAAMELSAKNGSSGDRLTSEAPAGRRSLFIFPIAHVATVPPGSCGMWKPAT